MQTKGKNMIKRKTQLKSKKRVMKESSSLPSYELFKAKMNRMVRKLAIK